MKKLIPFFMAWGMFCWIPCPYPRWDSSKKAEMLACFPLIGLMLGCLWAAAALLLRLFGGLGLFGSALLAVLPWLLTGFIHLDGYMDCSDAILSRRDLPERQRILKDSHVGSFAVIAIVLLAVLSFALMSGADLSGKRVWALVFIPMASRCPSVLALMCLKPLGTSGYSGMDGSRTALRTAVSVFLLAAVVLSPVLAGAVGISAVGAAAGAGLAILFGVRNLGGMSGDISGMAVTIGEFAGLLFLSLI